MMPFCQKCGAFMHHDDIVTHICDPEDIPEKGKIIRKGDKKQVAQL